MLMQQAWNIYDETLWEKVRLICFYAAPGLKKGTKLTDIIKLPSIDGNAVDNMQSLIEKGLAMRKMLNERNKKPRV